MKKSKFANKAGVYAIRCLPSGKYYVGFSTNVGRRLRTHFNSLKRNTHANTSLQYDFSRFGEPAFELRLVLESYNSELGYQLEANLIKLGGEATYNVIESKKLSEELIKRQDAFFSRVKREGDCLVWNGKRSPQGYGVFSYYFQGKRYYTQAHRVSYFLKFGDPYSSRISHSCDNSYCVNPDHLVLGVLNAIGPQEVPEIVRLYRRGVSPLGIAATLKVSVTGVTEIIRRECGLRMSEALEPGCLSDLDISRFHKKTKRSPHGDCLDFSAALNSGGFPTFSWEFGGRRRNTYAHRVAYFIANGECPDEVVHLCDNNRCVNPAHLAPKV